MSLEQRLIQSQKLVLTPQLRQYLKLLQLPLLDLRQAIEQELAENPVLEEVSPSQDDEVPVSEVSPEETADPSEGHLHELDFQKKLNEMNRIDEEFKDSICNDFGSSNDDVKESSKKKDYQESIISKSPTLNDYLAWQLSFLELDEKETAIAQEVIGNMDEDGYLRASLEEISQRTQAGIDRVEKVLKKLQTLDPPGVAARDLREALLIQLAKATPENSLARRIVEDCFPLLERKHFSEIARKLRVREENVGNAFSLIATLEPKPGRIFYAKEPVAMIPDASIYPDEETSGEYKIEVHHESVPRLKISRAYREMLKDRKLDPQTRSFLRDKMNSALWVIQAVSQRKNTLELITEEIVKAQKDFFDKGFAHLKPLRMKDIAEKARLHESTISRAVSGKYVVTPQGTIPYRSFFSNKMETENGVPESQKSIMEKVKALIENEDKKKPLSDEKLAELLKGDGIKIARRTVAKYRDLLKILPTYLRKER